MSQKLLDFYKQNYPLAYNYQVESCSDGWLKLLEPSLKSIQEYNTKNSDHQMIITTIKEKYGTLNIYMNFSNDEIDELNDAAEKLSETACESCGEKGKLKQFRGWYYTSCDIHIRK